MPDLTRITRDPEVMSGRACIRGMRVTVGAVVGLVASNYTQQQLLKAYPYLEADDIPAALAYAGLLADEVDDGVVERLQALFRETQALPQAETITEEDIALEIANYRAGIQ